MPSIEVTHTPSAPSVAAFFRGEFEGPAGSVVCMGRETSTMTKFRLLFVRIQRNANDNDSYSLVKVQGTRGNIKCSLTALRPTPGRLPARFVLNNHPRRRELIPNPIRFGKILRLPRSDACRDEPLDVGVT